MKNNSISIMFYKYKSIFNNLDFDFFINVEGKLYRKKENRETLSFNLESKTFFMKRFFKLPVHKFLICKLFGQSSNYTIANELNSYSVLKMIKINTPELVGFGWRDGYIFNESFLVSEELNHHEQLDFFIINNYPLFLKFKKQIKKVLSEILVKLHINFVTHSDLYLCHFFIDLNLLKVNKIKLTLIDFHRVKVHKFGNKNFFIKDISALFFSMLESGFSRNDLAFIENDYIKKTKFIKSNFKYIYKKADKLFIKYKKKYG